jgi:DNA-binding LacI/PurR family transcriptional regulator
MGRYLAGAPGVVVNVSAARIPGVQFPTVTADLRAAARPAVGHLLDQGFRNFGYFAPLGLSYVDIHCHSFVEHLAQVGLTCNLFPACRGKPTEILRPEPRTFSWRDSAAVWPALDVGTCG